MIAENAGVASPSDDAEGRIYRESELARWLEVRNGAQRLMPINDFGTPWPEETSYAISDERKEVYLTYWRGRHSLPFLAPSSGHMILFRSISYATPRAKFQALVRQWVRGRGQSSKIKDLAMHRAYQQIIGMGEQAIPLILEEMERKPGHWSWALTAISGEDPVPPSARGRLKETTHAWLEWGTRKGYR